jgi:hypothetical protein
MKLIFESCEPRPEVLKGELKEDIFAARLMDVILGKAEIVYQDPRVFFDNTFPTQGLKDLLSETFGRLTGKQPANNSVIRLETAFGGGKTHNLIALYHTARGSANAKLLKGLLDPDLIPARPIPKIVGIVGSDLETSEGFQHPDSGIMTWTLQGEIAHQLGGKKAYEIVRKSDEERGAAGVPSFEKLIGDTPTLIMLDEMGRYLRAAKAVATANKKSDLAEQTVATLISLLDFASAKPQVVVVLTLAGAGDAFAKETEDLRKEIEESKRVSNRRERVIVPTAETEISAIVTHRLFRKIDRKAAEVTASVYSQYYERLRDQEANIPERTIRAEYAQEMVADYPFHPELLTTLNRKTSTIPSFQKTRGALRLLARTVRELWTKRPPDATLIHPHHLDLSVNEIVNDLTSRLDRPTFRQVIEADIFSPKVGTKAHAQELDADRITEGKPAYTARAATAVFLHSLTQGVASGVDPADLTVAALQPGDEPAILNKSLQDLEAKAWFLDWDGRRYRFKTEPSLNKIVADEAALIGRVKAKEELDSRIKQVWKKGTFHPEYFPSEADDVDDDAMDPKLAVIHYDAATGGPGQERPPDLILKIFDHAGTMEGYRTYKNNLIFLVADADQVDHMVEVAQRYLAIRRIVGDAERMAEFSKEQREKLKNMQDAAELDVRVAITKAYKYLYYPSADAPKRAAGLARETLPPQDQGEVMKDQTLVVLRVLKPLGKILAGDDPPKAAMWLKAKAWPQGKDVVTTEDLRKAFAQRIGLPILLDPNQLKRTIKDGVKQGLWLYYPADEGVGYGVNSPTPLVQVSEDVELYTVEEAKQRRIKIKGEEVLAETCPVCGNPAPACTCAKLCPRCGQDPCVCAKPNRLHAEGAPAQVFQRIADQCADHKVTTLSRLFIRVEGSGKTGAAEARSLGLAIPQLGKGQFFIEQNLTMEFGTVESLILTFKGSWDRYKRLKTVTDAFGQEASKLAVTTTLKADFPDGLPVDGAQYQTIRDVFTTLEMGKLTVDAEWAQSTEGGTA